MGYLKLNGIKYPIRAFQGKLLVDTLKAIKALEDEGQTGNINYRLIEEKLVEAHSRLSTSLLWELALLGFVQHTKKNFRTNAGYICVKHTWKLSKNKKMSIEVMEKAVKEFEEAIKANGHDNLDKQL